MKKDLLFLAIAACMLYSCAPVKRMASATPASLESLLADSALTNAHTGVYVYNPATQKALHSYQSDKYFVPASNTKLMSCYAGMKYLGDSLVGLKYAYVNDTTIQWMPSGDPTFFHEDFKTNPVYEFLKTQKKHFEINVSNWKAASHGNGWAWNDYDELYMAERSPMPIYGNTMTVEVSESIGVEDYLATVVTTPRIKRIYTIDNIDTALEKIQFKRSFATNMLTIAGPAKGTKVKANIPFVTNGMYTAIEILRPTLPDFEIETRTNQLSKINPANWLSVHSQPTDSLLKPMMHRSDNFFAEQTLLMVSNEKLGYMNDRAIIDTLLKTDLKDLPQKPVWVDGSGLSRYNLFTPQTFVKVLEKMKDEFGMERMKNILPTGGEGTLSSLYKPITNQIFAKTGTLSGQVALSGYLFTKNDTLLIFSILVNNHNNTAGNVRKAVEKFVMDVWEKN